MQNVTVTANLPGSPNTEQVSILEFSVLQGRVVFPLNCVYGAGDTVKSAQLM